jgi:hypothetical protein
MIVNLSKPALALLAAAALTSLGGAASASAATPASHAAPASVASPAWPTQATLLSAQWWNWAVGQPASNSPLKGANCAVGQSGHLWNLAGAPTTKPITRSCTLPSDKSILQPVINGECSNVEGNGPTDQDLKKCATGLIAGFTGSASLDGRTLPVVLLTSQPFALHYKAGNVFGIGGNRTGTTKSVASGFWVKLPPLSPGCHRLHVKGAVANGFSQDVTYRLRVVGSARSAGPSSG